MSYRLRLCIVLCCYFSVASLFAQTAPKREFRGVWMSSVFNLDFPPRSGDSPEAQRSEFVRILDLHKQMGINAVFVQVRPSSDALYASRIEPWSQWLTGAQGRAPSPLWDPLQFMVEEAHKRGMELHAWFNPFRSVVSSSSSVAESHISRRQPAWHLAYTSPFRLLNPGLPEVRDYVLTVIMDVLRRYDIDGVHFDDYFYPYEGTTNQDAETFRQHSRGIGNIADWRRDNVNIFVKAVSDSIRAVKPFVKFGISPFGIWRSGTPSGTSGLDAYSVIYCDALAWLQARTVDYIVPQLYWKFGGGQDFARLMPWWNAQTRQAGRQMYSGLGAYRLTEAAWTASDITRQVDFNRTQQGDGVMFFSSNALTRDLQGLRTALRDSAMRTQALPPVMAWKDSVAPNPVRNLRAREISPRGVRISWDAPTSARDGDTAVKYVVYRFPDTEQVNIANAASIFAVTPLTILTDTMPPFRTIPGAVRYAVTALDRLSNESEPVQVVYGTTSISSGNLFHTALQSITPNPAQTQATVNFSLERPAMVNVVIVDNLGRTVAVPLQEQRSAGEHHLDIQTEGFASGVYAVQMRVGTVVLTRLLVVQK
jgi:uncharacterized lipoprotein YddW (UPF0748 family)